MRSVAFLKLEGSPSQFSCLVQDISSTGARLRVELVDIEPFDPSMSLPETFKLILPNDRIEIDCKLAWRRAQDIGILFTSNFQPVQLPVKARAKDE